MPEISLFQPTVLAGVVNKYTAPESLTMLSRVSRRSTPFQTAQWDVLRGSRAIARPNVPNAEAHIVPRLGREQMSHSFLYLREKKVFDTTTLEWVKKPGTLSEKYATEAVLREVNDINVRFDNFAEYALWQMFTGRLKIDAPDYNAVTDYGGAAVPDIDVDYKMPDTHKTQASVDWSTATPKDIIGDIRAWKQIISQDAQVEAREAYVAPKVLDQIFDSFALNGTSGNPAANLLSDRMKDQYYTQGTLPNFMGLDWKIQNAVFDSKGSAYSSNPTAPKEETRFLAEDAVLLGNFTDNRPFELIEGPPADLEAGGRPGKFSKTFFEPDPSARQFLMEWHLFPALTLPDQFVYAKVGS